MPAYTVKTKNRGYESVTAVEESNDYLKIEVNEKKEIFAYFTPEQDAEFLRTHEDPKSTWYNSCQTYRLQTHLAGARQRIAKKIANLEEKKDNPTRFQQFLRQNVPGFNLDEQIRTLEKTDHLMQDIHALSSCFIDFEKLLNNQPDPDPQKSLEKIGGYVTAFRKNIKKTIKYISSNAVDKYKNSNEIQRLCDELQKKMDYVCNELDKRIEAIEPPATEEEINNLLKLKSYSGDHKSLGLLMYDGLSEIASTGRKMGYIITGPIGENFGLGYGLKALSDAGKDLQKKMASWYGARFDSESKTPDPQLSLLTRPEKSIREEIDNIDNIDNTEAIPRETLEQPAKPKKRNLTRYMLYPNNGRKIADMLRSLGISIKKEGTEEIKKPNAGVRFVAGMVDFITTVAIFAPLEYIGVPVVAGAAFILRQPIHIFNATANLFNASKKETESLATPLVHSQGAQSNSEETTPQKRSAAKIYQDVLFYIWRKTSALSWLKGENSKKPNTQQPSETEPNDEEMADLSTDLIPSLTAGTKNQYISTLETYSPLAIAGAVTKMMDAAKTDTATSPSLWQRVYKFIKNSYNSRAPLFTVFSDIVAWSKKEEQRWKEAEAAYKDMQRRNLVHLELAIAEDTMKKIEAVLSNNYADPEYAKSIKIGETAAFLMQDISAAFADYVIDAPVRHEALIATPAFILGCISLGGFWVPSLLGPVVKSLGPLCNAMPNVIAQVLTGQQTTSAIPQLVACTTQYKALVYGTKAAKGDVDFSPLHDPEKIIAGGVALVGFGLLLTCVPHFPTNISFDKKDIFNPFAELMNFFTDEIGHATTLYNNDAMNVLLPARGLEIAFLGFKFGSLVFNTFKIPAPIEYDKNGKEINITYTAEQLNIIEFIKSLTDAIKQHDSAQTPFKEILSEKLAKSNLTNTQKEKIQGLILEIDITPEQQKKISDITDEADKKLARVKKLNTKLNTDVTQANSSSQEQPNSVDLDNSTGNEKEAVSHELETAAEELRDILEEKRHVDLIGPTYFKSRPEAMQFYDCLYYRCEKYNQECRKVRRFDKEIDITPILEEFYRNNCNKRPIEALRFISLITGAAFIARFFGYYLNGSPSRLEEINKYRATDRLRPASAVGAFIPLIEVLAKLIGTAFRPVAVGVAAGVIASKGKKVTFSEANELASEKAPHKWLKSTLLGKIRSWLRKIATTADSSKDKPGFTSGATEAILWKLQSADTTPIMTSADQKPVSLRLPTGKTPSYLKKFAANTATLERTGTALDAAKQKYGLNHTNGQEEIKRKEIEYIKAELKNYDFWVKHSQNSQRTIGVKKDAAGLFKPAHTPDKIAQLRERLKTLEPENSSSDVVTFLSN